MKRILIILFLTAALLAAACNGVPSRAELVQATPGALPPADASEVIEETIVEAVAATPLPTLPPTPTPSPTPSPTPTPTPSPTPTPEGLIGGKYPVFSYEDEPIRTESEYRSDKLSITVTRHTDNPYNESKLVYYVADIYLQDLSSLRTEAAGGFPSTDHLLMSKLASRVDALLAVNGDYYAGATGNRTLIIRNGIAYRKTVDKGWRETCLLYRDGTVEVFAAKELEPDMIDFDRVWQAWQFGPYLIKEDGSPRTDFSKQRNYPPNPRTVFGYYEPGHYCFVVMEGRTSDSVGLNLPDLAKLMVDLGCKQAFNFDGGATSVMYWNGKVHNTPCGIRSQVDILYLVEPVGDVAPISGSEDGEASDGTPNP